MRVKLTGIIIIVMALILGTTQVWAEDFSASSRQKRLFDYITNQNPYTAWATWQGEVERLDDSNHHGNTIKKYVNDIAFEALTGGARPLPYGSIIVQENYSTWGLTSITVMHKVTRGFNPQANDWFFSMYSTSGAPLADKRGNSCLKCHKSEGNTDMLLTALPGDYGKGGMVISSSAPSSQVN